MSAIAQPTRQMVRMRGRSYVAFVFSPVVPIVDWFTELDATIARSPGFFAGKPVVLDLSALDLSQGAIAHLVSSLEQRGIRVLGFEGVDAAHLTPSLPPLLTGGRPCGLTNFEPQKPQAKPKPKSTSLLLDQPVRSGQSIVFPDGDVTVVGSVGSGAEIVAGGSIHVYGTLRGRAMAGINGNSTARIFCQRIEAELLAIDGYYQTAEDIGESLRNQPAQAWLEGEILRITPLS
jgi:septum site-determining protein MinC